MAITIYATRKREAFPSNAVVREHGGFFVATVPDSLPGDFEIVAVATDHSFNIRHNTATIDYNEMTDLLEWAVR